MRHIHLILLLIIQFPIYSQIRQNHFDPSYFENQRFAHRGGYAFGPENTLQTILDNLKNGVTAIEIDVQLTRDNQLVLFHDSKVGRVLESTEDQSVNELTLNELKSMPLRDRSKKTQSICTLDELVDTLVPLIHAWEDKSFLLEVDFKPHGDQTGIAVDVLLDILNRNIAKLDDRLYNYFFVSSFYPEVLKDLQQKNPRVIKAFAVHSNPDSNKLKAKLAVLLAPHFVKKYKAKILEVNICKVTPKYVRKWHKKEIMINAYTANSDFEKAYLEKLNIAFTTNCPDGSCESDPTDQPGKPKKWCKKCDC